MTSAGMAHKAGLMGRFLKRKLEEYEALRAEIADLLEDVNVRKRI